MKQIKEEDEKLIFFQNQTSIKRKHDIHHNSKSFYFAERTHKVQYVSNLFYPKTSRLLQNLKKNQFFKKSWVRIMK